MSEDNKQVSAVVKRRPPAAGMGRVKGSQNKTTRAVKDALNAVYADLQNKAAREAKAAGAEGESDNAHLMTWALENPTEFYKLWVKMLPTEVSGPGGGAIPVHQLTDKVAALPREARDAMRAALVAAIEGKPK